MADIMWTRRRFAASALMGSAALSFVGISWIGVARADASRVRATRDDSAAAGSSAERWIELVDTHTSEVVSVAFHDGHGFVPGALAKLQYLLRDYRNGEQHTIDPALYVQLSDLAHAAGREPRYEVISGYRSPVTNAQLRARGRGVAEHSLHLEGRAIDVRLNGYKCSALRALALAAERGGVGFYARSDFVHLDTGRVRSWQG